MHWQQENCLKSEFVFFQSLRLFLPTYFVKCRQNPPKIEFQTDWIQLCVTIGFLVNTVYHKRKQGGAKLKSARGLITSLPEKEAFLYQRMGAFLREGLIYSVPVNSKTAHLPQAFDWSFVLYSL